MKKSFLLLCLFMLPSLAVYSEITLPDAISDGMVLQQQTKVTLWGKAEPGNTVQVAASWLTKASTKVDKDGYWEVQLATPKGSYEPHSLIFTEINKKPSWMEPAPIRIDNVLIGEVWFGGGQSNMEMVINGFNHCPIANANDEIMSAGKWTGKIRYLTVKQIQTFELAEFAYGKWQETNPTTVTRFGATAYFFAQIIQQILDVPVGIINCSWGGSRVEGWLPREILKDYPEEVIDREHIYDRHDWWMRPMEMYNGMLFPLRHYTIRGFIWYQGCANVDHPEQYTERLSRMVGEWRRVFKQGELPFYFTEIAPFTYDNDANGEKGALLREAQWRLMDVCPRTAGISTNDLVEPYEVGNIHPKNKQDVGKRLAYLALNDTYMYSQVECHSPRFERCEMKGDEIYLYFSHAANGWDRLQDIEGFEIEDANGLHPANVRMNWDEPNCLILSATGVTHPISANYCFHNARLGNLHNMYGLPIVPFKVKMNH